MPPCPTILADIPTYQQSDGHFGVEQHLPEISRTRDMPILWGNGRMLIGLVEVYDRTGDRKVLETAKKLGDYFVTTDPVYDKAENLNSVGGTYSDGFATCYFSCIEGLVGLARVTQDDRYLDEAKRIAELAFSIDDFTGLHSHGRLCTVRGFADLYAATGAAHWRDAAERDWAIFMERYRLPTGGVKEVLNAKCNADEGCSVCDWLRLNLSLWRLTGEGRYLDEAERCLKGHFLFQQFPNGGAGHRWFYQIDGQPVAFKGRREEAWWCCGEHWARAMVDVARFDRHRRTTRPLHQSGRRLRVGRRRPGRKVECDLARNGRWAPHRREEPNRNQGRRAASIGRNGRRLTPGLTGRPGSRFAMPMVHGSSKAFGTAPQEIVLHLPTTLRSESAPGDAGVLLRGHDVLVAHRLPANAWLMEPLAVGRPVVLWAAALPTKDGRIIVPASDAENADPNNPEQWKLLELAPLRAVAGQAARRRLVLVPIASGNRRTNHGFGGQNPLIAVSVGRISQSVHEAGTD